MVYNIYYGEISSEGREVWNGGCVYGYFQDMIICGKPVLDTMRELYKDTHITDYMEKAYGYCLENETAIRQHIEEAEKAF